MTTIAFLAATPGSASIQEQERWIGPDDYVVMAGQRGLNQLTELLARSGTPLKAGDWIKIHDLTCLALSTSMLIRALRNFLGAGISIEIVKPGIVLVPGPSGNGHPLLDALDGHYRHAHGIKTHPADTAQQGRKRLLAADQLPAIRAMLDRPGATATTVAEELGVARSTLFNYLQRFGGRARARVDRPHQVIKRRAERAGDKAHIPER